MTLQHARLQSGDFHLDKQHKSEAPDERVKTLPNILLPSQRDDSAVSEAERRKSIINEMKNDYFLDVTLRVSFR